jgi:hypothetical protein
MGIIFKGKIFQRVGRFDSWYSEGESGDDDLRIYGLILLFFEDFTGALGRDIKGRANGRGRIPRPKSGRGNSKLPFISFAFTTLMIILGFTRRTVGVELLRWKLAMEISGCTVVLNTIEQ